MDAQRKLRNLLSYTKPDSVEELEDCNKLYEELLAHLNKQEKKDELLGLKNEQLAIFQFERNHFYRMTQESYEDLAILQKKIDVLEKELGEMK